MDDANRTNWREFPELQVSIGAYLGGDYCASILTLFILSVLCVSPLKLSDYYMIISMTRHLTFSRYCLLAPPATDLYPSAFSSLCTGLSPSLHSCQAPTSTFLPGNMILIVMFWLAVGSCSLLPDS